MTRSVASARTAAGTRTVPSASLFFAQTGPVVTGSNSVLAGLTALTIECFINNLAATLAGNTGRIIDFNLSGTDVFAAFSPGSNQPILKVGATQTGSAGNLPSGVWHHLEFDYDGANMYVFIDGTLKVTTANASQTTGSGGSSFDIGNIGVGSNRGCNSFLQDLRISNIARHTSGFTAPTSQLSADANTLLLYHFNEFRGTTVSDSSANSITGTLSGSPLPQWSPGNPNITILYPGTPRIAAGTRGAA